jgi:hypothetical protein
MALNNNDTESDQDQSYIKNKLPVTNIKSNEKN